MVNCNGVIIGSKGKNSSFFVHFEDNESNLVMKIWRGLSARNFLGNRSPKNAGEAI